MREKLGEQLLQFVPLMYKKLKKGININGITRQQMELLFKVNQDSGRTMKYYGDKMMIPKSNLSIIADKLIEQEFLSREIDSEDRRVILLKITDKGKECLKKQIEMFKYAIAKKLEALSDEDAERLNALLEEMICIFNKIE